MKMKKKVKSVLDLEKMAEALNFAQDFLITLDKNSEYLSSRKMMINKAKLQNSANEYDRKAEAAVAADRAAAIAALKVGGVALGTRPGTGSITGDVAADKKVRDDYDASIENRTDRLRDENGNALIQRAAELKSFRDIHSTKSTVHADSLKAEFELILRPWESISDRLRTMCNGYAKSRLDLQRFIGCDASNDLGNHCVSLITEANALSAKFDAYDFDENAVQRVKVGSEMKKLLDLVHTKIMSGLFDRSYISKEKVEALLKKNHLPSLTKSKKDVVIQDATNTNDGQCTNDAFRTALSTSPTVFKVRKSQKLGKDMQLIRNGDASAGLRKNLLGEIHAGVQLNKFQTND